MKWSNSEQKYPIHQLEILALKWTIVDKFHDYLYESKFTVPKDNNPLTYMLTSTKLNAMGHHWLASLATYDFDVQYQPGKTNVDADLLSRSGVESQEAETWRGISEMGVRSTWVDLVRNRFFWPMMAQEVEQYIKNYGQCVMNKTSSKKSAPLHHIVSNGHLDLVSIDFLLNC